MQHNHFLPHSSWQDSSIWCTSTPTLYIGAHRYDQHLCRLQRFEHDDYAKVDLDPTVISFYSGEAGSSKEAGTGKPLFLRLPILCNFKSSSSWWSWIVGTFSKIAAAIMLPYVSVHVTLTSGWKLSWLSVSSWLSKMVKKLFSQKKSLSADLWLYLKIFRMHWVNWPASLLV